MAEKIISTNREARRDYIILESCETGIELKGTEVKSLRESRASLKDSFARCEGQEIHLYNMHINPYSHGNIFNKDPRRMRKLLLHKSEIKRLVGKVQEKGLTLIPLRLYFKHGLAKVELALAKGKKFYDKREDIKLRDAKMDIERALKTR